jgi:hypothetical protein
MYQTQQNWQQQQAAQRQQQFENQLAYMEAMAGGDKSQFERLLDQAGFDPQQKQEIIRQWVQRQAQGSGGTRISYDDQGNPVVQIGGPYSESMRPSTQGQTEQEIMDLRSLKSRLQGIKSSWNPDMLTYGGKLKGMALSQLAKMDPDRLTQEQKDYLVERATMMRRVRENLNLYIQEITGAQMSQEEAKRLRGALPDAGDGLFDGDDPISFAADLQDVIDQTEASLRRYEDLRERGLLPRDGRVTEELTKEYNLRNPRYYETQDDLSTMSKEEVRNEFDRLYEKAQNEKLTPEEYSRFKRARKKLMRQEN